MKKRLFIITALLLCLITTACTKVYEGTGEKSFRVISNVKGLSFDMYESFLDGCLFTTGILDTDQLNNGSTYVYRNDSTDYMAYNSRSFGVVAQKINSLDLNGEKKSVVKSKLSNLYFLNSSVTTKASGISYKKKVGKEATKYITTKQTEVGIAPNVLSFQNYYGYLAYIECNNGDAYAIFAGTIAPLEEVDGSVKDTLYHIASSMKVTEVKDGTSDTKTDTSENEQPVASLPDTNVYAEEPAKETTSVSVAPKPEVEERDVDLPNTTDKLNVEIRTSAYNGTVTESTVGVKIKSVNRDAEDMVKKLEADYFAPMDGCHLELAEYEISNKQTDADTVRINVVGADFEKLTYNGIKYSKRTYDVAKNGKIYVYYEIPNGCKEYVLEIGGMTEKGYFYVK